MFTAYEEFREEIEEEEGRRHTAYKDHLGFPTIGVGHLIPKDEVDNYGPDVEVSDEQIDAWLDEDIEVTLAGARRHFPKFDSYGTELQLGIMQWLYQLGPDAPLKFPSAKRFLNEGKFEEASEEMIYANPRTKRHSSWYNQTPARCRRQAERVASGGNAPVAEYNPDEIAETLKEVVDMLADDSPETRTDIAAKLRAVADRISNS